MNSAKSIKKIAAIGGGSISFIGAYIGYDYKTCHPMRQMAPYNVSEGFIRLRNTIKTTIPPFNYSLTTMSLKDLETNYNGKDGNPTYFSADGKIYDVSSSTMFQSVYSQWAGADATICLAKMSMEQSDINRTDYESLTEDDIKSLHSWTKYFHEKYLIKGQLKEFITQQKQS